jgi:hypothetical protein
MHRLKIKPLTWMGFITLIWLFNAGVPCLAGIAHNDLPISPIENPLGDMEDPNPSESENENDKESDDDNLYDERLNATGAGSFQKNRACEWDLIHDDPCHNLNSPPPKF